jgi:hypothetical protein
MAGVYRVKYATPVLFMLSGCAVNDAQTLPHSIVLSSAKSICELVLNRDMYLGKQVVITAKYGEGPHQRFLYDEDCADWSITVSNSPRGGGNPAARRLVQESFKRKPTIGIPVIYAGVLVVRLVMSGCTKPNCYSYSLQDAQIWAASPREK